MNNSHPNQQKEVICFCTGATKAQIKEQMDNGMDTFDKIANQTGAGTGCGSCDYLIVELLAGKEPTIL